MPLTVIHTSVTGRDGYEDIPVAVWIDEQEDTITLQTRDVKGTDVKVEFPWEVLPKVAEILVAMKAARIL